MESGKQYEDQYNSFQCRKCGGQKFEAAISGDIDGIARVETPSIEKLDRDFNVESHEDIEEDKMSITWNLKKRQWYCTTCKSKDYMTVDEAIDKREEVEKDLMEGKLFYSYPGQIDLFTGKPTEKFELRKAPFCAVV